MPTLFNSKPGTYVKIQDDDASAVGSAIFTIDGLNIDNLIVTKYGYSQSTRVQYRPTLGGDIYIYPLGDEMGTIQVSGIVPFQPCEGDAGEGFAVLADFYDKRRASKASNAQSPIQITLPGLSTFTLNCFLESLAISGVDPKNKLFGFDIVFRVGPKGAE